MYLYDFYKIFTKCLFGYIIWKNAKKLGVTMLVIEWQTKMYAAVTIEKNHKRYEKVWCEGNKIVSTLKHPGKHVNALEMILNNKRAVNFVCQCFQGKNWSIQYLAVCGKSVILWQFGVDVPMWFLYNFQEMLFWVHTFKNCDHKLGSPGLFRSYSAKCKQQSQLRKIVNTTRRYVLRKIFLTLSLCWIFSFVDTIGNIFQEISVVQRW